MTDIKQQLPVGTRQMGNTAGFSTERQDKKNGIKMDDFLKILAASMSNPSLSGSEGGGNSGTDYISQLVQFTTLEQLQELGSNLEYTMMMTQQQQAISMVGKKATMFDNGKNITGTIEKVKFSSGFATLVVDGKDYLMSQMIEVGE
ncbi:flagellar hook capping FlgD N-terminal domain-containing protein [Vagococcus carniphilus]|nr:flagellar hook capping FlgD N-terminal domain-containing protein [Vagococcus carniphilus]QNN71767.1 flagellar basal body rod modification protein [Vagococcus carniphilus]